MSDSDPQIVPVTDENRHRHVERWERQSLHKSYLKASDRRRNFDTGEIAGVLRVLGTILLCQAASGWTFSLQLPWWGRVTSALLGVATLGIREYIRRRFWKQTEDAEKFEEMTNGTNRER